MRNANLGYITQAVQATLAALVLFGLPLSQDQQAALVAVVAAWGIVWIALNDRRKRTPEV